MKPYSPRGRASVLGAQFKVSAATGSDQAPIAISLRSADGETLTAAASGRGLTLELDDPGSRAPRRLHPPSRPGHAPLLSTRARSTTRP
jgi:hypothetical protein